MTMFVYFSNIQTMKKLLYSLILLFSMTQLTVKADEPLKIIVRPIEKVNFTPVSFKNTENGLTLAGILFTPRDFMFAIWCIIFWATSQKDARH